MKLLRTAARPKAGYSAAIGIGLLLSQLVPAAAQVDNWFVDEPPQASYSVTDVVAEEAAQLRRLAQQTNEDRFRGQSPHYLRLLRVFAEAVTVLAESTATVEIGQREVTHVDVARYEREVEADRRQADKYVDDRHAPQFSRSGDPALPYRIETEWVSRHTRLIASRQFLRVDSPSLYKGGHAIHVVQRAWGGQQTWTLWPAAERSPEASLGPAYTRYGELSFFYDWEDVRRLWQALAFLVELGPPATVRELSHTRDARLILEWPIRSGTIHIAIDRTKSDVPVHWTTLVTFNHAEYERARLAARLDRKGIVDSAEREREFMRLAERLTKQGWDAEPLVQLRTHHLFSGWRRRSNGVWLPQRIERWRNANRIGTDGSSLEMPIVHRGSQVVEFVEWITWDRVGGRVTPREAFAEPPGYEHYTAYQWTDRVLPANAGERRQTAAQVQQGLALEAGSDLAGDARWVITEVDPAFQTEWPFQLSDVILGFRRSGPGRFEFAEPGQGSPDEFLNELAAVLERGDDEWPAVVRLARDHTIVDIICWTPESTSGDSIAAVEERIVRSRTYPPMPYDGALTLAHALLDATAMLVHGRL